MRRLIIVLWLAFSFTLFPIVFAQEIHEAVKKNDIQTVQELLSMRPDYVNLKEESGRTPLHIAAEAVNFEVVKLLVENGAEANAADNNQQIPLHLTAFHGNRDIAIYLISKGADVNRLDIRALKMM